MVKTTSHISRPTGATWSWKEGGGPHPHRCTLASSLLMAAQTTLTGEASMQCHDRVFNTNFIDLISELI